jgi:hypothetical protein
LPIFAENASKIITLATVIFLLDQVRHFSKKTATLAGFELTTYIYAPKSLNQVARAIWLGILDSLSKASFLAIKLDFQASFSSNFATVIN